MGVIEMNVEKSTTCETIVENTLLDNVVHLRNDARTCEAIDTGLTQPRSADVLERRDALET